MLRFVEPRRPAGALASEAPADTEDDWSLWRRACEGHGPSATRLVDRLTPQAFGLAIQLLGKTEDAQDAVQDAFLRLWRSDPGSDQGARLSTYFNTIVVNRCRSARSARREQATDPDDLADLHEAQGPAEGAFGADPAHAGTVLGESVAGFTRGGLGGRLQRALARLPARQRQALALWAHADADAPAIARALELDVNAAHQLLHRARRALRARLEETDR